MRSRLSLLLALFALAAMPVVIAVAQDQEPAADDPQEQPAEPVKPVEMNELEKKFEKTMSGSALVGQFTILGQGNDDAPPAEERYVITKVTKIGEDRWLFMAKIGDAPVPIPLPIPVKWAGDTPVISVTKLKVPGMGTYSARVLIYDNHYAGTWDAGEADAHRGHLWGRVERADKKQVEAKPAAAPGANAK